MIELLLLILGLIFIYLVYLWFRNEAVYNLRTNILWDINARGPKFSDMLTKYKSISYESMVFSFKSIKRLEKEMRKKIFGGKKKIKLKKQLKKLGVEVNK